MKSRIKVKQDKNTAVINLTDFMRIQNTIVPSDIEKKENDSRKDYDKLLKERSKAKMYDWPDSIELSKKKKLEERKKEFFKLEEEKRIIDEEERKFQELEKQLVVDKADKYFFENQDAVKSFHSKLLLADAIKEREYQKEIQKRKKEIEKDYEETHLRNLHQQLIEYDRKEELKDLEEKAKREHRMSIVNHQLNQAKIKKIKEYQDNVIEGEIIKKKAKEEVEEQLQREREKVKRIEEANKKFVEDNIKLEKLKEQRKALEILEEKKIEEFAIKKQEMIDLRKRKEEEKFNEKQRQRQIIIDKQVEYLKNLKNKQDEILKKHNQEAEEKRNNELAERDRKFREFKKQIDDYRDMTMKRKNFEKEREKLEDREFLEKWNEKMKLMREDEKQELQDIRNRNKNLQRFHVKQIDLKKVKAEKDFRENLETAFKTSLMLQNENDEFLKYAESWVQEYYKDGKDITPLLLDLKAYKKKIYAN